MKFKETLIYANQLGISPWQLMVAAEVSAVFYEQLNGEPQLYEDVCYYIYDKAMSRENISILEVRRALQFALINTRHSITSMFNEDCFEEIDNLVQQYLENGIIWE